MRHSVFDFYCSLFLLRFTNGAYPLVCMQCLGDDEQENQKALENAR
jgi:hypothetical protein